MRAARTKWIRVMGLSVIVASLGAGATWLVRGQAQAGQTADPPRTICSGPSRRPGAKGTDPVKDVPSLKIWLPRTDLATGAAVVVCPGGGYGGLADDHEGKQVAEWLNSVGVAAFVLKYRLGRYHQHPAMSRTPAWRSGRSAGASNWGLDPHRIAIIGFSAGGHLASTAGTHFDAGKPHDTDPIERVSSRPDRMILVYPVIALATPYGHSGSLRNLLGDNPAPELVESLSNERQVNKDTPPTFLWHTNADKGVPAENSLLFALALRKAGVPVELHLFEAAVSTVWGWETAARNIGSPPTPHSRPGPSCARPGSRIKGSSTGNERARMTVTHE